MGSSSISGMSFPRVRARGWRAQRGRKNSQPMAGGGASEAPGRLPCSVGKHRGATYERSALKPEGRGGVKQKASRGLNPRLLDSGSRALAVTPRGHTYSGLVKFTL